jgi:dihydroorotase
VIATARVLGDEQVARYHGVFGDARRAAQAEPGAVGLAVCFGLLLSLVQEGRLALGRAIAALTSGPARVLGLPRPCLAEGERADFVLFAPDARWTVGPASLHGKSYNSPVLGRSLPGRIDLTVARGQVAFDRAALDPAALTPHVARTGGSRSTGES